MKNDKSLISRWDTAPHHKNLKSFPFHRHVDEMTVVESQEIDFLRLLEEIKNKVISNALDPFLDTREG